MKNRTTSVLSICGLFLIFCISAHAQQNESKTRKTLRITGKITIVLVKASARAAFETAKFTGRNIIVPAVKNVGVPAAKATPPLLAKAVKLTAKGVKNGIRTLSNSSDVDKKPDQSSTGSTN